MASRKQRDDDEEKKVPTKQEAPEPEEKLEAKDSVIELEIGEPEEADDDDAEEAEERKPTRREKKQNRFREAQERAERAERMAEEARNAAVNYQAQLQQYQQNQGYQQYQQQLQAEEERLLNEQQTAYTAFEAERAAGLTPEREAHWRKQAQDIERRKFELQYRRMGGGQQPSTEQIAAHLEQQRIVRRYADIAQNPRAWAFGDALIRQRLAEGAQPNEMLYDEVAEETRRRFGMPSVNGNGSSHGPRRPAPDTATKARFSGMSARGSSTGGESVSVKIGPTERRLAAKLYPNLSEEKAIRKWAEGPGKRAALAQRKSG